MYLTAGTYTFSWGKNVNSVRLIVDGNYSQPAYINISTRTITSTTDGYIGVSFRDTTSSSTVWDNTTPIMLNTGSTALPYEPNGYKIPISSANTTTPVYLGEVGTTRKIKKLVLTGQEESWAVDTTSLFILNLPLVLNGSGITSCVCTHYNAIPNIETGYSSMPDNSVSVRYNQLKYGSGILV